MAEATAEGGAGVGRQRDRGLAPDRKDKSGKVESFQAAVSLLTELLNREMIRTIYYTLILLREQMLF
jgi:hypothetical protein